MTVCIQKLNVCVEMPVPKEPRAAREPLSARNRLEWADYLPNDPEALLAESRQKAWQMGPFIH